MFSDLGALAPAIHSRDAGELDRLQDRLTVHEPNVRRGLSFVGATVNRVEAVSAAGDLAIDRLAERRSAIEEIDLAEAVLRLNAAQAGYQAALGAAAKANLPTLADFLK